MNRVILMRFTRYKKCPSCNNIFHDPKNETVKLVNPLPVVKTGEMRSHWPSLDIMILSCVCLHYS